jgi:hypothetical protein
VGDFVVRKVENRAVDLDQNDGVPESDCIKEVGLR